MRAPWLIIAGGLVLGLVVGCGGGSEDGGGTGNSNGSGTQGSSSNPSIDQLPAAYADATCGLLGSCCSDLGIPLDAAGCRTSFSGLMQDSIDSADPANYEYDANAAGNCLQEASALDSCTGMASGLPENSDCNGVFKGKLAPGDECASDIECQAPAKGSVTCDMPDTGTTGVCRTEPIASEGDPCYWTCTKEDDGSTTCSGSATGFDDPERPDCFTNDGLFCSAERVCAPLAAVGDDCTSDDGCVDGAFCDAGSCAELLGENDPCTFSGCGTGLFCKDQVCVPQLEPGATCEAFDECRDGFCDSGVCSESTGDLGDVGLAFVCALASTGLGDLSQN